MLLLNEKDIDPSLKLVLDEMLKQLTGVNSMIESGKLKENATFKKLSGFINQILQHENPLFMLETVFSTATNKYSTEKIDSLSAILSLAPSEIKIIEEGYSIKYPKKLNLNKKDMELLDHTLSLAKTQNDQFSEPLRVLKNFSTKPYVLNMVNYYFNAHYEKHDFKQFAKQLQSQFLSHKQVSIEKYNKYFNVEAVSTNLNEITPISGMVVFNKELTKTTSHFSPKVSHTDHYEQVSIQEVLGMGFSLDLSTADKYHYFKNYDSVYPVKKSQPILDCPLQDSYGITAIKNSYSNKEKISFTISEKDLEKGGSFGDKLLDYHSMQKIRTAVLKPQPKWVPGSILKADDCLMYIASYPQVHNVDEFVFTAVVVNPLYLGEYFVTKQLEINQKNIGQYQVAEKIDTVLFYEAVNSAFQQQKINELRVESHKKYGM